MKTDFMETASGHIILHPARERHANTAGWILIIVSVLQVTMILTRYTLVPAGTE